MQIVSSLGDNLHEISKPVFSEKKKNKKNIFNSSSAEFAQGMVRFMVMTETLVQMMWPSKDIFFFTFVTKRTLIPSGLCTE